MFHLLIFWTCCIQLAMSAIETNNNFKFFYLRDEIPNREPRILSVIPSGEPNTIAIPVVKPIHGDYFLMDAPEENKHESLESAQLNEITQKGRQVADGIYIELRKVSQRSVAVLVQDDEFVIETAAIYINYILEQHPIIQNDFWLFKYNASGVTNVLSKTSLVDRAIFLKQLRGDENGGGVLFTSPQLGAQDGIEDIDSGVVFFSILKAARQLPFGSEILVFTNGKLADEDLAQLAIRETFNKQIRILAVWQGTYPTQHKEEKLLFEATTLTHGKFFVGNTEHQTYTDRRFMTVNNKANPVIAHLMNIRGHRQVRVPIEDGVSALHISLTNNVNKAYMRSPSGYLIDLLNMTAVVRFTRSSYVVKTGETFEIDLALGGGNAQARPAVGVWLLETDAFVQHHYSIVISARHDLRIETNIVGKDDNDNNHNMQSGGQRRRLQLNINGDYAKIDNVTLLTSNGVRVNDDHLKIRIRGSDSTDTDIESVQAGGNVDIDLAGLPQEQLFIEVRGTDKQGNAFQRISYYNPVNVYNTFEPITINLGMESQLYQETGRASNIFYEVTNNRDNAVFMQFTVKDQQSYLHRLYPVRTMVNPHQTVVVTVTTISRGGDDMISFTAYTGSDKHTKRAQLKTASGARIYDVESPHMWHKYTSSCIEVLLGRCEDRSWTIEVTAQDQETGLLNLVSSPEGLFFPAKYVSGTTQEVIGVLSGSCCHSSVVLTAVDLAMNKRSYVADAYWAPLSAGTIAAIVIGVLLLIVLIAILIYFLSCGKGKCCGKKSDSMDLPPAQIKYRGPVNSATTSRY